MWRRLWSKDQAANPGGAQQEQKPAEPEAAAAESREAAEGERLRVLRLLEEGKITVEQGAELLEALR
jgi:hypothetical protein